MVKTIGNAQVYIYESEYRTIISAAREFSDIETGGDLYGLFSHGAMPIIWLVSHAGPQARHEVAHFEQDPAFTTTWQNYLHKNFGLQYIGSWHSHHKLTLKEPSNGDMRAAQTYACKHKRDKTLEIIVNHEGRETTLRPYFYPNARHESWVRAHFIHLPGESPIRTLMSTHWEQIDYSMPSSALREGKPVDGDLKVTSSAASSRITPATIPDELREEMLNITNKVEKIEAEIKGDMCMLVIQLQDEQVLAVAVDLQQLAILQVNLIGQNNSNISQHLRKLGIPFHFRQRDISILKSILCQLPYIQQQLIAEEPQRLLSTAQQQQRETDIPNDGSIPLSIQKNQHAPSITTKRFSWLRKVFVMKNWHHPH